MAVFTFHYLLMAIQAEIQRNMMEKVKSDGITLGQPKVLDYLKDHDGANQKEIASACHIEPGSLTSILNRMEDRGIIERRIIDGNRRTFYIFLTKQGVLLKDTVEAHFAAIEKLALNGLSQQEKNMLIYLLEKIYSNLMNKK